MIIKFILFSLDKKIKIRTVQVFKHFIKYRIYFWNRNWPNVLLLNMIVCLTAKIVAHRFSKLSNKTNIHSSRSYPSEILFEFVTYSKDTISNVIFNTNQKHSYAVCKRDVIVAETTLRHKLKSVDSNHEYDKDGKDVQ